MCVAELTYGGTVCLLNEYMKVLCVLVKGHMEIMWCW